MIDLEVVMKALLELAERATDDKPSFTVTTTEFGIEVALCGGSSVQGKTISEALSKLLIRVGEELVLRSQGDREALKLTEHSRLTAKTELDAASRGRQLLLPDIHAD